MAIGVELMGRLALIREQRQSFINKNSSLRMSFGQVLEDLCKAVDKDDGKRKH
jgi:hypothetical protein